MRFTNKVRLIFALVGFLLPVTAFAHPMGNFSVNHYSKLTIERGRIKVDYIVDLAEIPTYQELQQGDIKPDAASSLATRFVAAQGISFGHELSLSLDGKPLPLRMLSSQVLFPPGAGGLPTMKMAFIYEALYSSSPNTLAAALHYVDNTFAGHTGWKEIIAVAATGISVHSSVPSSDRSAGLTNYPTDLLTNPPQDLEATIEATFAARPVEEVRNVTVRGTTAAGPALPSSVPTVRKPAALPVASAPPSLPSQPSAAPVSTSPPLRGNRQNTPRDRFTELITQQHLSPWFLFTAALLAMALGGLHALEPGHGKTIVAAYLIGARGTARHAVLLGTVVTASHTAGVFALGLITLYASRYIVPEQLYPWLGVLSGLIIAGLGISLFLRRALGTASEHSHLNGDAHRLWFLPRRPARDASLTSTAQASSISMTQLFTLGITGGIIPCPAALIVLLSAFALHRLAFGFFLIIAFSIGLAAVLVSFGMAMVYARRFMAHLELDGPLTKLWMPLVSATFIVVLGVGVTLQALAGLHVHLPALGREKLGPILFIISLGLILGMRHSTDPDHVVAISTIVTRQRSLRNAALIGSVWGLGHTITIFVVGSLIIMFGVVIPPRLGLSMEFCVAIMLIVLGILNLTGVMQRITARFTLDGAAGTRLFQKPPINQDRPQARMGVFHFVRPLIIGLVHGLAGSAAVALLVLSTIHSPRWATAYLVIFGLGTVIGMMCMTTAMAFSITYLGDRFTKLGSYLGVASGMVSVCFGFFLVYQLGFVGGLFTNHPEWTPR